jgi:hypothetical protein
MTQQAKLDNALPSNAIRISTAEELAASGLAGTASNL